MQWTKIHHTLMHECKFGHIHSYDRWIAEFHNFPMLLEFIKVVHANRGRYKHCPETMHDELLLLTKGVNEAILHDDVVCTCPTLNPIEIANIMTNTLKTLYESRGLASSFSDVDIIRMRIQEQNTARVRTYEWVWATVICHIWKMGEYVWPFFLEVQRIRQTVAVECDFSLMTPEMKKLVSDVCFTFSKYLGDHFTTFCHIAISMNKLTNFPPNPVVAVLSGYLQILHVDFHDVTPKDWLYYKK